VTEADGSCFETVSQNVSPGACSVPYIEVGTICKFLPPLVQDGGYVCPEVAGVTIDNASHNPGTHTKLTLCSYTPAAINTGCPAGTTQVGETCRRPHPLENTGLACQAPFTIIDGDTCVRHEATVIMDGQCPTTSTEDTANNCRKPVANQDGPYICPNGGALSGTSCVFTAGFLIDTDSISYMCEAGDSAVLAGQAVCLLAGPTDVVGVGCLQGVLSTDGQFCLVDLVVTPASVPVPSFTG